MSDAVLDAIGANGPAVAMLLLVVAVVPQILKAHSDGVGQYRLTAEQAREILKDEREAMQSTVDEAREVLRAERQAMQSTYDRMKSEADTMRSHNEALHDRNETLRLENADLRSQLGEADL